MSQVITRFAPSPTGYLHIGGARTALFNWLYARHTGGKFLLRIEDTDKSRSTQEAMDALLQGLTWLGLDWDEEPVYQSSRIGRHIEVAEQLLKAGKAYRCYTSQEELESWRTEHPHEKYRSPWRDGAEPVEGTLPVIRLKAPMDGEITVHDLLKGTVSVDAKEMDDMVLLRADGTPTYMLAVVVDDHDMGITHAIRGNDHFTNKFRQLLIYDAMDWQPPKFAHVPLILGEDGTKLSKRHGATGIEQYEDMGFLPAAMRNYLLRLGWSYGDKEMFTTEEMIKYFDFDGLGKSPSRMDLEKLKHVNQHYMRQMEPGRLLSSCFSQSERAGSHDTGQDSATALSAEQNDRLTKALPWLIERAATLVELRSEAAFLLASRPLPFDEKAKTMLTDEAKALLKEFSNRLEKLEDTSSDSAVWQAELLHDIGKSFMEENAIKPKQFMPPLRAALSGKAACAGTVYQIMEALGKQETLGRVHDVT